MKRLLLLVTCLLLTTAMLWAQKKAPDYMNAINKEFKAVNADMWNYMSSAIHAKGARKVEAKRKELIKQISTSIEKIKKMPPFDDDETYRDAAAAYLQANLDLLNEDFKKIAELEGKAETNYADMLKYIRTQEEINEKMDKAAKKITDAQEDFATSNDLKLSESKDKVGEKMEAASEVYRYYNPLFLIFFRSNRDEANMLEALKKGDEYDIELSKFLLDSTSFQGLEELKEIKDFKGDQSLKAATAEVLKFYQTECGKKFVEFKNFAMKESTYKKAKAEFDAKPAESHTKQEVNAYNKIVADYNAAVTRFNTNNQVTNDTRTRLVTEWYRIAQAFTTKHIPK